MSVPLRKWAIGGILLAMLSVGVTGVITGTLAVHGMNSQVDTSELEELSSLQNRTGISETAQQSAEDVEARSEFFSLPGVVNTLRTVFDSIPVWQTFITVAIDILGLGNAHGNWIQILAASSVLILVGYRFVVMIR